MEKKCAFFLRRKTKGFLMRIDDYIDTKNSEMIETSLKRDKVAGSPEQAAIYVNTSRIQVSGKKRSCLTE
jgi:hypothetical protein